MTPDIIATVLPYLLAIIAAVLTPLISWAAVRVTRLSGIEIEAHHRAALHSALMTGIRWALGRGLTGQAAVSSAVDYATRSVPDALAALHPTPDVLHDLASSKLREVIERVPMVVLPPPATGGSAGK